MTVWSHLPTIFKRRYALYIAGILTLCVAFITTLFFTVPAFAAPNVTQTMNFQGRLLNNTGGLVNDGNYNIQFKIYQGDTNVWTENYVNNNTANGVKIKNGYFSVALGSRTTFGTSVDWTRDDLSLSINIAGTNDACTTFGSAPCTADGEMSPRTNLTSVPLAIQAKNAALLEGKAANEFVQLGQGAQTDAGIGSSIFINKTGSGNLLQLQNTAADVFTIGNTGNITLGSNANKTLSVATSSGSANGYQLSISAGGGGATGSTNGGNLVLTGGHAGINGGNGGNLNLDAGTALEGTDGTINIGTSAAGTINIGATGAYQNQTITIGSNTTGSSNITIGTSGSASSGTTTVQAKNDVEVKTNGTTRATFSGTSNTLYLGNGASSSSPNDFLIQGTGSTSSGIAGGSLTLQAGTAYTGNANGGNLTLDAGAKAGSGNGGTVSIGTANASSITMGNASSNTNNTIYGSTIVRSAGSNSTTAFQLQNTSGISLFTADTTNMEIVIGNGGNTITLSSNGITFAGTTRGAKQIRLAAEYQNTVLDNGSTGNNAGTMLSSTDLSNRMNFYRWQSASGSAQTYDIVTQVPIPQDFSAWAASNPLAITSRTTNTTNGTIRLEVRDSSGTIICTHAGTQLSMGSTNTWITNTPNCLGSGTYTPGDYLTIRLRMSSASSANTDVGNIVLNYLSNK